MPSTGVALYVFLLLMPGLISQAVFETVSIRPLRTPANRLIDAALFAAFDLGIYFGLTKIFRTLTLQFINFSQSDDIITISGIKGTSVAVLIGVSLVTGFVVSFCFNKDWLIRLLRMIRITNKYSRPTLWMQIYETYSGAWARVNLQDKRRIEGVVAINSDLDTEKGLLLEDVVIYDEDGEEEDRCQGLYVEMNEDISFIQLYHPKFKDYRSKFKKETQSEGEKNDRSETTTT